MLVGSCPVFLICSGERVNCAGKDKNNPSFVLLFSGYSASGVPPVLMCEWGRGGVSPHPALWGSQQPQAGRTHQEKKKKPNQFYCTNPQQHNTRGPSATLEHRRQQSLSHEVPGCGGGGDVAASPAAPGLLWGLCWHRGWFEDPEGPCWRQGQLWGSLVASEAAQGALWWSQVSRGGPRWRWGQLSGSRWQSWGAPMM